MRVSCLGISFLQSVVPILQLRTRLIRSVYVPWQGAPALIVPTPGPSPHAALDCAPLCDNFAQRQFLADREPVRI